MGDASGVGPEIALRAYVNGELADDVVIYGDAEILAAGAQRLGLALELAVLDDPAQAVAGRLNVVDLKQLSAQQWTPGQASRAAGAAARAYVLRATDDALAGRVAAVVTLPMNKAATNLSDPSFCGHTELIAERCHCDSYALTLACDQVAAAHVTGHVALADAIAQVRRPRVLAVIELLHQALARFIERPRIAVAGLNPHAGEGGLFGDQDQHEIAPAVTEAQARGWDVSGPWPADTLFYLAVKQNRYDGIVCMYHDQGHGAMKLLAFESGVNVTLGLPIIRTSVDHGTAFDIAWQGQAFTKSLCAALQYARQLNGRRPEFVSELPSESAG